MNDGPEIYCYPHPHPAVTADAVVLAQTDGNLSVLLIQRARAPYARCWALPGGFIGIEEDLEAAAQRELREETGITGLRLAQLGAWGRPGRDPRERVISVAFYTVVPGPPPAPRAGDDALAASWFDVKALPPLAFDHAEIIEAAIARCSRPAT